MSGSIEISEEEGVRYLHFGSRWIQGAMRIARPWSLELDYTRDMMVPLLLQATSTWPRTVLSIGLGASSLAKFVHRHRPRAAHTIVEIEPAVIDAARQFFKLPEEGARMRIEIADGVDYVASSHRRFDLILVDGFDAKGRAGALDTLPFYCNCQARLSSRGLLAVNLLTRNHGARASRERIAAAFNDRMLALPLCESGNIVALGAAGDVIEVAYPDLAKRAHRLHRDTGLNLRQTIARLRERAADGDGPLKL
jgi:spermidine synthase